MGDERISMRPVTAREVPRTEGTQEQFGLVEPRGVSGRHERSDRRIVIAQESRCGGRDVARPTVPDDVDPARPTVTTE